MKLIIVCLPFWALNLLHALAFNLLAVIRVKPLACSFIGPSATELFIEVYDRIDIRYMKYIFYMRHK